MASEGGHNAGRPLIALPHHHRDQTDEYPQKMDESVVVLCFAATIYRVNPR